MERAIIETCSIVSDMKVCDNEAPAEKVMNLALVIKDSKNSITKLKFDYEVQILELQIRFQPSTPPEVREQRQKDLSTNMKGISDTVVDFGQLLNDTMHIWTLQEDLLAYLTQVQSYFCQTNPYTNGPFGINPRSMN